VDGRVWQWRPPLFLMPEVDLACEMFSGHYNAPDSWITPMRVWWEAVLANLVVHTRPVA
jgi:hypothetical protein